mmetsp:Transcript_12180/g.19691  ORF Transcript_12180/g.19691 Transcript_12180/m.19691 type:complete len:226 (+) Transcript_12180:305-982(+)
MPMTKCIRTHAQMANARFLCCILFVALSLPSVLGAPPVCFGQLAYGVSAYGTNGYLNGHYYDLYAIHVDSTGNYTLETTAATIIESFGGVTSNTALFLYRFFSPDATEQFVIAIDRDGGRCCGLSRIIFPLFPRIDPFYLAVTTELPGGTGTYTLQTSGPGTIHIDGPGICLPTPTPTLTPTHTPTPTPNLTATRVITRTPSRSPLASIRRLDLEISDLLFDDLT